MGMNDCHNFVVFFHYKRKNVNSLSIKLKQTHSEKLLFAASKFGLKVGVQTLDLLKLQSRLCQNCVLLIAMIFGCFLVLRVKKVDRKDKCKFFDILAIEPKLR